MKEVKAGEVLTTAVCPLSCKYCYIPKSDEMQKMHREIADRLRSGEFLDTLEKVYGNEMEYLGFWGAEPTLTLSILTEKVPEIMDRFPKLKEVSFSTSLMTDPSIILDFIVAMCDYKVKVDIQISLDGPSWITDVNRIKGAAEQIPKNFEWLTKKLNNVNLKELKVQFGWKATHSVENMKMFLEDTSRVVEYYSYFEALNDKFKESNKNKNVILKMGSFTPTLMVPGKYTSEDGKIFARYLKGIHEIGHKSTYSGRLRRILDYSDELYKKRMFTCSGGDSNLGLGTHVHICHRTFYFNYEAYVDSILNKESSIGDVENWDVSLFYRGTIEHIQDNFIIDPDNKVEMARFIHTLRGYHDFWRQQMVYVNSMMKELARVGQVDPIYLEDEGLLELFTLFANISLSCPMENLLNNGSIHLQVISLLRLFGNGAFQLVVKDVLGGTKK